VQRHRSADKKKVQRETGAEKERFRDREIHRGGEAEIEKQRQIRAEDETLDTVRSIDREVRRKK
jgi:hypothetical protein